MFARITLFVVLLVVLPARLLAAEPLKLLTIGNSFAADATYYLPEIAEAEGRELILGQALIGGGSLNHHLRHLDAYLDDPNAEEAKPYRPRFEPKREIEGKLSLKDMLTAEAWDIVTIQQVSYQSFRPDTYEPAAERLIAYIREHAPTAEIVVIQTWAYRPDHRLFADAELDQQTMFERLRSAYDTLAARYDLRVVPIGEAFQLARQNPRWQLGPIDETYDFDNPVPETLPVPRGELCLDYVWRTHAETGEPELRLDGFHANFAGRYLGALVMYEVLFGEPVTTQTYLPAEKLSEDEAASLREAAHAAVQQRYPSDASATAIP